MHKINTNSSVVCSMPLLCDETMTKVNTARGLKIPSSTRTVNKKPSIERTDDEAAMFIRKPTRSRIPGQWASRQSNMARSTQRHECVANITAADDPIKNDEAYIIPNARKPRISHCKVTAQAINTPILRSSEPVSEQATELANNHPLINNKRTSDEEQNSILNPKKTNDEPMKNDKLYTIPNSRKPRISHCKVTSPAITTPILKSSESLSEQAKELINNKRASVEEPNSIRIPKKTNDEPKKNNQVYIIPNARKPRIVDGKVTLRAIDTQSVAIPKSNESKSEQAKELTHEEVFIRKPTRCGKPSQWSLRQSSTARSTQENECVTNITAAEDEVYIIPNARKPRISHCKVTSQAINTPILKSSESVSEQAKELTNDQPSINNKRSNDGEPRSIPNSKKTRLSQHENEGKIEQSKFTKITSRAQRRKYREIYNRDLVVYRELVATITGIQKRCAALQCSLSKTMQAKDSNGTEVIKRSIIAEGKRFDEITDKFSLLRKKMENIAALVSEFDRTI